MVFHIRCQNIFYYLRHAQEDIFSCFVKNVISDSNIIYRLTLFTKTLNKWLFYCSDCIWYWIYFCYKNTVIVIHLLPSVVLPCDEFFFIFTLWRYNSRSLPLSFSAFFVFPKHPDVFKCVSLFYKRHSSNFIGFLFIYVYAVSLFQFYIILNLIWPSKLLRNLEVQSTGMNFPYGLCVIFSISHHRFQSW